MQIFYLYIIANDFKEISILSDKILNPKDVCAEIDYFFSLDYALIERMREGDLTIDRIRYKGKPIGGERVSIYAVYAHREINESNAAVLLLNDIDKTIDYDLIRYFERMGYSVLMPDYRGETEENRGKGNYTIYPEKISYANYEQAGRRIQYADESVLETSWFEWIRVAKFSYDFLKQQNYSKIGVVGIRGGGEIVWKLIASQKVSCGIVVNAAGWQAYKGYYRYDEEKLELTEERCRFISGLDSQAYAPFIQSPILMLCTGRDERCEIDRAYDTYARINFEMEKAIAYSVKHNGYLGENVSKDIQLFLSKYLTGRQVFIPTPVDIQIIVSEENELIAVVSFDEQSSVLNSGLYCIANPLNPIDGEWTQMPHKTTLPDGREVFLLNVCSTATELHLFAYATCTNGFLTTSKIVKYHITQSVKNSYPKNRVLFSGNDNSSGFYYIDNKKNTLSDILLLNTAESIPKLSNGYGNILGLLCNDGLISYRPGMEEYSADENSLLSLDVYCNTSCELYIGLLKRIDKKMQGYFLKRRIQPFGKWKKFVFKAKDFEANITDDDMAKEQERRKLESFKGISALTFQCVDQKPYLVNNIIWI